MPSDTTRTQFKLNFFKYERPNFELSLSCKCMFLLFGQLKPENRLRVVSNFGDGDCGADEIHTRARNFEETRREGSAEN